MKAESVYISLKTMRDILLSWTQKLSTPGDEYTTLLSDHSSIEVEKAHDSYPSFCR